ncbi:PREDICTED: uncharacterized protein LOC104609039 [Nelumbo nucifera]|uniref:Uncharacterized protein LOC104609039 n=1 Tax=Nelumbo nucifera TaxID=4432 RepID=A0A1U8BBF8_NELNU|nr:PREDICTED: uncharacterized protein LOC104609039 [Nelumbo nucifera]
MFSYIAPVAPHPPRAMAETKLSIKLLVDKSANKVLFAEVGKDFVDFLFNLLATPLGTIVKLLTKKNMVGSVGNLYESVKNLSQSYIQPDQKKEYLLNPRALTCVAQVPLLLPNDVPDDTKDYYMCGNSYQHYYVTNTPGVSCPSCGCQMSRKMQYVESQRMTEDNTTGEKGGYVKGVVTYMVMDDLAVMPMSTISTITLLNKFNVKEVGNLEERVVDVGFNEGVALVKASLQSTTVLTDIFLGKMQL